MDPIAEAFLREQAALGRLKPKRQVIPKYGAYEQLWGSTLRNAIIEIKAISGAAAAAKMLDGRKFTWPAHIVRQSQKTQFVNDFVSWARTAHPAHSKKIAESALEKLSRIESIGAATSEPMAAPVAVVEWAPAQTQPVPAPAPAVALAPAQSVRIAEPVELPARAVAPAVSLAPGPAKEPASGGSGEVEVPAGERRHDNPIDAQEEKIRKQRERLAALQAANEKKRLEELEREKKSLGA